MKMNPTLTETLCAMLLQLLPAHLIAEARLALHFLISGIATANHFVKHSILK